MTTALILAFLLGLVALSYWVGRRGAGYGVAVFVIGIALGQFVMSGPSSFLGGDCYTDWNGRSNATVCE